MTSNLNGVTDQRVYTPASSPVTDEINTTVNPELTSVEGTVVERKFESILSNEIYASKEGQSRLRTVAVAVLSTVTGLIVAVAVYDLVRYGLFKLGACNGKSWSLIDQASNQLKTIFDRSAEIQEPKTDDLNEHSKKAMKRHVNQIVEGYRKQQGGMFFGQFFDSSRAIDGEKQIARAQKALAQDITDFLAQNSQTAEEFLDQFTLIKGYVQSLFVEAAKDDIFIENKIERKGPRPLLSEIAIREFEHSLQASQKANSPILKQFLGQVDKDFVVEQTNSPSSTQSVERLVKNLSVGMKEQILTPEQAKAEVVLRAKDVYTQALESSGPKSAQVVLNHLAEASTQGELIQPGEDAQIIEQAQFTPTELAEAVAKMLIQYQIENPNGKPVVLDQILFGVADELVAQGKLSTQDIPRFVNETRERFDAAQAEIQLQTEEAEAAVHLRMQQEAEAAEALKVQEEANRAAEAQKAKEEELVIRNKQNLFDLSKNMLNGLSDLQARLLEKYMAYDQMGQERAQVIEMLNLARTATVAIGKDKKVMTVLQAIEYRSKKIAAINASNREPKKQSIEQAQFDQDFGAEAIAIISQLQNLEELLNQKRSAMIEALESIDVLDKEMESRIKGFRNFYERHKKKLDPDQREEIRLLREPVLKARVDLTARYCKAHHLSPFSRKPSEGVEAAEVNLDTLITENESEVPTTFSQRLWRGATAPLKAVGLV